MPHEIKFHLTADRRVVPEGGNNGHTLLWIAAVILDIFAISDVMNSSRDTTTKIVLLVLILLLPFVGAGLYLFAFRDKGYS